MQAGSLRLINLAQAVMVENMVPIAGSSLYWPERTQMIQSGSVLASVLAAKGAIIPCVAAAASLPDLDQRLRLFPHRMFTHSLVEIVCLLGALLGLLTFKCVHSPYWLHITGAVAQS